MNLLVYGTLLFPEIRNLVGGREFESRPVTLEGYGIYRVKNATFPGVIRETDSGSIEGEVLLDISEEEMMRFDSYEDSFYERCTVSVSLDGQPTDVELYVVPPEIAGEILTPAPWNRDWFEEHHLFDFYERLRLYNTH